MTAITAAVILLVATVPAPLLEGAIIDRRLRQLTKRVPLSYDAIDKVTETLKEAHLAQAKLSIGIGAAVARRPPSRPGNFTPRRSQIRT